MNNQTRAVATAGPMGEPAALNPEKNETTYKAFGSDDSVRLNVALIKKYIAIPAKGEDGEPILPDDSECIKFIMLCRAQRLNPWTRDSYMLGYRNRNTGEVNWSLITAHGAFLKRAELHPDYDGLESGVIVKDEEDQIQSLPGDFVPPGFKLLGGWASVHFKRRSKPMLKRMKLETYQKPFGVWVNDSAGMICKCFDEKTEVLTTRGFELFSVAEGQVMQVTPGGLRPTDVIPFVKPYTGEMVRFDNQNLDFCVTPNHDMITDRGTVEAGNLSNTKMRSPYRIPRCVTNTNPDAPMSDRAIQLAAAFLCDGYPRGATQFGVSVSRPRKIAIIDELGGWTRRRILPCAGQTTTVATRTITTKSDKTQYHFLFSEVAPLVSRDRRCNTELLLTFSARQAKLFVDTLISFDGHISETNVPRFFSSRPEVIQAFELASVLAGYSVAPRKWRMSDISKKPNAMIAISSKTEVPVIRYGSPGRGVKPRLRLEPNVSGRVWCVTVPSGKIVVRREGFSFICGNCAEVHALRDSFPTMLGGMMMREEYLDIESEVLAPKQLKRPEFATGLPAQSLSTTKPEPAKPKSAAEQAKAQTAQRQAAKPAATAPKEAPAPQPVAQPPAVMPDPEPQEPAPEEQPQSQDAGEEQPEPAEEEPLEDFEPDPNENKELQSVRLLMHGNRITEEQVLAWARSINLAKSEQKKLSELSEAKLVRISTNWGTILPDIQNVQ